MTEEEELEKEVKVLRKYSDIAEDYVCQFVRGLLTLDELYETLTAVIKQRDLELETKKEIAWKGYWKNEDKW